MPGPHGRGNDRFAKPKDAKKTLLRLLGYLSRRKLPLVGVGLLLLVSVGTNLGVHNFMDAISALELGNIKLHDKIIVRDETGKRIETTAGRIVFNETVRKSILLS